jgi:hypothetical protein
MRDRGQIYSPANEKIVMSFDLTCRRAANKSVPTHRSMSRKTGPALLIGHAPRRTGLALLSTPRTDLIPR